MSAAIALPSVEPIDWSTVAPEEWPYLADLVPWPPLRAIKNPTPPPARDLPPEQRDALEYAVTAVGATLSPERRWDLRQDLALTLLESDVAKISNVRSWLLTCARNRLASEARDESRRREILEEAHDLGAPRGYRMGPTWHPPHEGAERFAPFACKGARVMHCRRPVVVRDVESALADWIDNGGTGLKRTPTGPQDRIAETAIRDKRTLSHKSTSTPTPNTDSRVFSYEARKRHGT
jgi:hypothetical protein